MKVSIDGILGSARRINSQKELEENNQNKKKSDLKVDSVSISSRLNTRIDAIETEIREIQSSLTRNQIIQDGLEQLSADLQKGGQEQKAILDNVTFEGKNILRSFIGEAITEPLINTKREKNTELINGDVNRAKKLQVELDNIMASDLAGHKRLNSITSNIDSVFSKVDMNKIENISSLKPDSVMRLIK